MRRRMRSLGIARIIRQRATTQRTATDQGADPRVLGVCAALGCLGHFQERLRVLIFGIQRRHGPRQLEHDLPLPALGRLVGLIEQPVNSALNSFARHEVESYLT